MRTSAGLARMVLACFVLALGVATAAPLFQAVPAQVVCSADGRLRLVLVSNDGGTAPAEAMHCPLCLLGTGAAPVDPSRPPVAFVPGTAARLLVPTADGAPRTNSGVPPPARGPPRFS